MKILIVGKISGDHSKLLSYERAFKDFGHEVKLLNLNDYYRISKINRFLNWFLKTPRYFNNKKINKKVIGATNSFEADLIIFYKPLLIRPSTINKIKKKDVLIFSWTGDSIFYRKNVSKKYLESLSLYDCNFFQNKINILASKKYGSKRSKHLPSAVDRKVHYPVEVTGRKKEKWGSDIVFIGTYSFGEKRGKWLEKLCEEGYNVKVYGNRWERCLSCSCLRKNDCITYKAYYGKDFSKIINSSKITINFLREHNKDSHNSRTFEVPACGGFMLHEKNREEARKFLEDGKDAVFFVDYAELKNQIDYYLKKPKKREEIAKNGHKRVKNFDCSFKARAKKIIKIYNSLKK